MSKVVLTAGYDRAWHSVLVAEKLRRAGRAPSLILLAYPASLGRIKNVLRNRGLRSIVDYLRGHERVADASPVRAEAIRLGVAQSSLRLWARKHQVPLLSVGDLNGSRALRVLKELRPTVTVYTGGGILRKPFIDMVDGNIINAHSGPLPEVRGMNALEWSLLLGKPTGVTVHLIDVGIDTGHIIEWVPVPAVPGDNIISLRERMILAGAQALARAVLAAPAAQLKPAQLEPEGPRPAGPSRQCFVLAPALRELAALRLAERIAAPGIVG